MNIDLIHGDSLEVLKKATSNSVDTIITDPPYGLSFMGKKWDYDVPSVELWTECLRVLKPGGTALIFAGSRTSHRMAVNVEDAGFTIKDTIMWLYGSGFPKATDISKQLDKTKGLKRTGVIKTDGSATGSIVTTGTGDLKKEYETGDPVSIEAKLWNGWKSHGLKPAYEPIIVAMKPNDGTYANNALVHGVSGLNIDGGRIGVEDKESYSKNSAGNQRGKRTSTTFVANAGNEHISENPQGRFPANIILECICETECGCYPEGTGIICSKHQSSNTHTNSDCPGFMLDEQSGVTGANGGKNCGYDWTRPGINKERTERWV
jgi:site-specific DNA-methyltransferase (adenine-specific)